MVLVQTSAVALQSQLPKASMNLATSASGSTVYMEPEPVVTLNNAEAMLRAQEQEEEEFILAELSQMVKQSTMSLQRLMKAVTALDIASARARHATWLLGTRPVFISEAQASEVSHAIVQSRQETSVYAMHYGAVANSLLGMITLSRHVFYESWA